MYGWPLTLKYFNVTRIFLPEYTAYQVKKKSTILKGIKSSWYFTFYTKKNHDQKIITPPPYFIGVTHKKTTDGHT